MHSTTASLSSKLLSLFFAATLAFGLVPSAAFAASDDLQSIPEGSEDAASIAPSAEGGSDDVFSHYPSDDASSADGAGETASSEDVPNTEKENDVALPTGDIINETQPLQVVAQAESTRSYFLAQTLESTRTVPVVSAKLPIDTGVAAEPGEVVDGEGIALEDEGDEDFDGSDRVPSVVASASTVVGSFTYLGMTFAIESDSASAALIAAEYSKLPQEFIEKQVVIIPDTVTADDIDYYSVTRIADNAFASFKEENANPEYTGCEVLFSDAELLAEAGVAVVDLDADTFLTDCVGILALGVPASVTTIEDDTFSGFSTLQCIVVSEGNENYASYDGVLYDIDESQLVAMPEGRKGVVRIAPNAALVDPEVFSRCPMLEIVIVERNNGLLRELDQKDVRNGRGVSLKISDSLETGDFSASENAVLGALGAFCMNANMLGTSGGSLLQTEEAIAYAASYGADLWAGSGYITVKYNGITLGPYFDYLHILFNSGTVYVAPQPEAELQYHSNQLPDGTYLSTSALFMVSVKKTGYTFRGWARNNQSLFVPSGSSFKTLEGGVAYDAWWDASKYTVSFDSNGGDGGQSANVTATYGSNMPGITTTKPTRIGYTFDGWYDTSASSGGTQYYTAAGASARIWDKASNTTLYARWTPNPTYTVSFDSNGGDGGQSANVTVTYDVSMPSISMTKPTRTGYEFMGWYDNVDYAASGATKYYNADGTSARTWNKSSGAMLYAGWRANDYTITWNPRSGSVDATGKTLQTFGNELSLPPTPTREGYTFAGWWTIAESAADEKRVGPGHDITQVEARDAEYFARWDKVSDKVTLKSAGGTFTQSQVNAFNSAAGDHPIATLNSDETEIEIPFDVDAKPFSLDLLKPTLTGSTFTGWSPAFAPPSWNASTLSWNNAVTYTATWSTNSYEVTYQDKNGNPLVGWTTEDGTPSASALLLSFNEATPAADRALPSKLVKRGYTWVKWTRKDTGATVTSIPCVSEPITIVANFTPDPYTVKVDLAGGSASSWPKTFRRTYDEPTVELPATKPTRAGYVFSGFEAYASEDEDALSVLVIDVATDASVDTLQPGKVYRVLDLTDGKGDVYDVTVLRAVWTPRIAVQVPASIDMGVLASFESNTLKFQYGGVDYSSGSENVLAPLPFTSYTTAPVVIVAITDDTQDAEYATRAAFAEKVFGGAWNASKVSFTVSSDAKGANSHSFSLGGSTDPDPSGFLQGFTIAMPTGSAASKTTTFYLGMDFGDLTALDILTKESGSIAKLYYTVALLDDPESEPSVLEPYDGDGILW